MQGSVRKKGATWSYRVEFGVVDGKRNQIERSGFRTKGDATKAMNEVILSFPDFIKVIKEVTDDDTYKNVSLANI